MKQISFSTNIMLKAGATLTLSGLGGMSSPSHDQLPVQGLGKRLSCLCCLSLIASTFVLFVLTMLFNFLECDHLVGDAAGVFLLFAHWNSFSGKLVFTLAADALEFTTCVFKPS